MLRITTTVAWISALLATLTVLACLWLARYQPIEMDLAMLHYCAFLINEKHFLLYRDIFENNLPGPFFFHALIGKLFGYSAPPIRIIDACILAAIAVCSWKVLAPLSKPSALLAPALFALVYITGGSVAAFQRDYIAIVPLILALAILCNRTNKPVRNALWVGALCGAACSLKPNFIVVAPALYWILLTKIDGAFGKKLRKTFIPAALAFLCIFAIPFLWGLKHADYQAFIDIYKGGYTELYVNTRSDLFHYDNAQQRWLELFSMQADHLMKMAMLSIPGLLWAWRQHRDNPALLIRLRALALMTFAISWHEVIAGKFWFAHLLPPHFFAILCFSLLLTPIKNSANIIEKIFAPLPILMFIGITYFLGSYNIKRLESLHYTAENHDIRSQKIARYLIAHLQPNDKVQSLDGSGDGQGALLLARATYATRFLEDIPLYLQPNSPVTQAFRREFLNDMAKNPPAYFVYIHNFFHPAGGNRLKEFHELYQFLQDNYDIGEEEDGQYTIYRYKKLNK